LEGGSNGTKKKTSQKAALTPGDGRTTCDRKFEKGEKKGKNTETQVDLLYVRTKETVPATEIRFFLQRVRKHGVTVKKKKVSAFAGEVAWKTHHYHVVGKHRRGNVLTAKAGLLNVRVGETEPLESSDPLHGKRRANDMKNKTQSHPIQTHEGGPEGGER